MENDYLYLIVEVAVTVYVFLLGLPTLVTQIFLPEDLRRMSKKNYAGRNNELYLISLILVLILVLAYVATEALLIIAPKNTIATVLFITMLVLTLRYLFNNLIKSQGYRARIIEEIKKRILESHRKDGKIDPAFFHDMQYLGIYSKAGTECRIIIDALGEILAELSADGEISYSEQESLSVIIEILCDSVVNSEEPGNRRNLQDVLSIYISILMDLKRFSTEENQLILGNETRKIRDCTTKIALTALKAGYSDLMLSVLTALSLIPKASDNLFEIGVLALDNRQFSIATKILAKILRRDDHEDQANNNYLGLLAHFFAAGESARHYVNRSLTSNRIELTVRELDDAIEYHYIISKFDTVDRLQGLKKNFFPEAAEMPAI